MGVTVQVWRLSQSAKSLCGYRTNETGPRHTPWEPPASLPPRLCVLGGHGKGEAPGKPTSTLWGQGTLAEDYLENGESGKSKRILTALGTSLKQKETREMGRHGASKLLEGPSHEHDMPASGYVFILRV